MAEIDTKSFAQLSGTIIGCEKESKVSGLCGVLSYRDGKEPQLVLILLLHSIMYGCTYMVSLVWFVNRTVRQRSPARPNSFSLIGVCSPRVSCRTSSNNGQICRMWWGICSSAPHSHCAVSTMPILFMCLFRPQCPVRRRKMVVCSRLSSFFYFIILGAVAPIVGAPLAAVLVL